MTYAGGIVVMIFVGSVEYLETCLGEVLAELLYVLLVESLEIEADGTTVNFGRGVDTLVGYGKHVAS